MKIGICFGACAVLLAAGPLGAGDKGKDDKFDPAKLVGTWKLVAGVKDGQKMGEEDLKKFQVILTKDQLTLKADDATFEMKYDLDAKKKPIAIKLEITKGPIGEGSKADGIIELNGDDLKLCYASMGGDAPKTFEAKEGSKVHLFTMKRTK
jgi:uncharacterized protein (TIGR03067 family)